MTLLLDKTLYIQTIGQGSPLVFFHGWGFDHTIWQPLVLNLSQHFTCYLVDLPGFGSSSFLPDWQDFKQILLPQLPKPFALVGWSLGGLYGLRLAFEEPSCVSHLMMVTSSPCFKADTDWPGIAHATLLRFLNRLKESPQQALADFMMWQGYQFTPPATPSLRALTHGLNLLVTWDLRPALAQLLMPTSFLFGRLDAIVPRTLMNVMQQRYPDCVYHCLPRATHVPFLTHPQEFIRFLRDFYQ